MRMRVMDTGGDRKECRKNNALAVAQGYAAFPWQANTSTLMPEAAAFPVKGGGCAAAA